jgi:hypothetical protein
MGPAAIRHRSALPGAERHRVDLCQQILLGLDRDFFIDFIDATR